LIFLPDASTVKQEDKTWSTLGEEFNQQSTGLRRTAKQLQDCYKNMKAMAKKRIAADKVYK